MRLKVFVGAAMTAEGPRDRLAITARSFRHDFRRDDIVMLANVVDRTSRPLLDVPPAKAAIMAETLGADGLILTGDTFAGSLDRIRAARAAGVRRPMLLGGGVTTENLADSGAVADGVVVSSSLLRPDAVRALPARMDGSGLRVQ